MVRLPETSTPIPRCFQLRLIRHEIKKFVILLWVSNEEDPSIPTIANTRLWPQKIERIVPSTGTDINIRFYLVD